MRIGPSQNGLSRAPLPRTGPLTSSLGAFGATTAPRPARPCAAERPFQRTPLHQREFTYPSVALAERERSSRALALVRSSNAHPHVSCRPRVGAHSVSSSVSPSGVARALARRLSKHLGQTVSPSWGPFLPAAVCANTPSRSREVGRAHAEMCSTSSCARLSTVLNCVEAIDDRYIRYI